MAAMISLKSSKHSSNTNALERPLDFPAPVKCLAWVGGGVGQANRYRVFCKCFHPNCCSPSHVPFLRYPAYQRLGESEDGAVTSLTFQSFMLEMEVD